MTAKKLAKGQKIRVLVVDDSVVIRQLVISALGQSGLFEVVGTAPNGVVALQSIETLKPDVVTLDVEMPDMDGITTLREIRKRSREILVIMFSTLTQRSAETTLQALALGANDYVAKVSNVGSLAESMARLQQELVPKLRQFFVVEGDNKSLLVERDLGARLKPNPGRGASSKARAVAIGVSTGGPTALAEIVPMFPANMPVPVFIVQHMPALFTKSLAERLQRYSKLMIHEAVEGMPVSKGNIYLAPGDFHMTVCRGNGKENIKLNQEQPENSCRPAVDVLFRSVNETYKGAVIAVVLTGMGQDGKRGVEVLRANGAKVIAQDQKSSVVWGMPGAIVQAGLADSVVDLKNVVSEIVKNL